MKKLTYKILALLLLAGLFSCEPKMGEPVAQISLQRIRPDAGFASAIENY